MTLASKRGELIFRKTERELLRLSSGQTSEGQRAEVVHGFRTTTRRLETLLDQIIPERTRNQKKLLKMLSRIRKSAGKVRDIDAQLAALRSLKIPQEPRRKTQLTQGLLEARALHEKKLGKLLNKSDIRELQKRLKRAIKDIRWEKGHDALAVARRILNSVALPAGPVDEETLHRFRIAVKRARYAAEFAPDSREAARFIVQLKRLQDALGHWHDWLTLTNSAVDRFGDLNQSSLVAAVQNVTRAKFRVAIAAIAATQAKRSAATAAIGEHDRRPAVKRPLSAAQAGTAA